MNFFAPLCPCGRLIAAPTGGSAKRWGLLDKQLPVLSVQLQICNNPQSRLRRASPLIGGTRVLCKFQIRPRRGHIHCPLSIVHCQFKKILPSYELLMGREYALHTSWCHPRSGTIVPLGTALTRRCTVGSAGVLPPVRLAGDFQPGSPSLWRRAGILLPRHGRCYRRLFFGRIISLQSRSPRCRPRISISAEARLVAQGTL